VASEEWREQVSAVHARIDGLTLDAAFAGLGGERAEELRAHTGQLNERIDHAFSRLDEVSSLFGRVDQTEERLAATEANGGDVVRQLAELHEAVGRHAAQPDGPAGRSEQGAREVEERLAARLAAVEAALAEVQSTLVASGSLADRIGAVEERAAAISMHSAQEIELLRRQLTEQQAGSGEF